jgi:hypothetical protein
MLVVRGRLPPEQGALFLKALEVARDELRARNGGAEPSAHASATGNGSAEASPDTPDHGGAESSPPGETRMSPTPPEPSGSQVMADALARVAARALAASAAGASSPDRFQVVVHVDAEVLADPEADGRCELEDGPAISPETVRRLACDAALLTMVHGPNGELWPGRKTRVISAPLRRALKARDGTRCTFPGCSCRGRHAHHVKAWAAGGATALENVTNLCAYHHHCVHEGGYRVEAVPGGRFRFIGPDGREVLPAPMAAEVEGDGVAGLALRWLPQGVEITAATGLPTWQGEPCDYDWAVRSLKHCGEQAQVPPSG